MISQGQRGGGRRAEGSSLLLFHTDSSSVAPTVCKPLSKRLCPLLRATASGYAVPFQNEGCEAL